jgi:hypothetical protein
MAASHSPSWGISAHHAARPDLPFAYVGITRSASRPGSNDPDAFVVSAAWVPLKDALARRDRIGWYNSEPLRKWLAGEARAGASYEAR